MTAMWAFCLAVVVVVGCVWETSTGLPVDQSKCATDQQIVRSLFDDYDRHRIPNGGMADVKVSFWLQHTRSVCGKTKEAVVYFWWASEWKDEKLDFSALNPCKQNITLGRHSGRIWNPTLASFNALDFQELKTPVGGIFTLLTSDGTVMSVFRSKVTVPCQEARGKFKQGDLKCDFKFDSLKYNVEELKAKFDETPPLVLDPEGMNTHSYKFDHAETATKNTIYPAGNWQELTLSLFYIKKGGEKEDSNFKEGNTLGELDMPQNDGQAPSASNEIRPQDAPDTNEEEEEEAEEQAAMIGEGEGVIPAPETEADMEPGTSAEPPSEAMMSENDVPVEMMTGEHVIEPDVAQDAVEP